VGARVAAVPLLLGTVAAVTGVTAVVIAVLVGFGLHSLWIWVASLWLVVGADVRRGAFLMLVLAAGLVGVALLIVPEATGSFFSWELKPAGLTAFAGGVYVGSAVVYAVGLPVSWRSTRGLVVGAVVLSVSVFVITLAHAEVFDFGRLQAWAWMFLFAGFGVTTTALLARGAGWFPVRTASLKRSAGSASLAPSARAALALVAAALAGVALASREPDVTARLAAGVGLALVAAAGFGCYFVFIDEAADASPAWAVLVSRGAASAAAVSVALALGRLRPPAAALPPLIVIGLFDVGANGLLALALSKGLVSLVSVLSSLYPVVTIALARAVLGERIGRVQAAGAVTALAGVAMISAG
jgi:uncharacterized membrane protein